MALTYLKTNTVHHNFETSSYENVLAELEKENDVQGKELLEQYPNAFPFLNNMRSRHSDDDAEFSFREVPADDKEIVTEADDVLQNNKNLELVCDLKDGGKFGITVDMDDRAGEDAPQLNARINFAKETLDQLNAERLKRILEFCEKHGLSVWDIQLPYRDGLIDADDKLATLTRDFLQTREQENLEHQGASVESEDEKDFNNMTAENTSVKSKKAQKTKTLDDTVQDFVDLLEKDLHKTRGLTYFVNTRRMHGRKTYVFSIYDKPNKDNMKMDGIKDKNGTPVPTYSYRLYVSQDSKGKFYFGFATPGGKKMDDAMAGDLIGVIKGTGVTHIRFSDVHNLEKGVWLMACAEKGITPIGISINTAKAKAMVEAAKKKLNDEDLIKFKRNLAEQMIENAAAKCKDPSDPKLGLSKSEWSYIESLRGGYDFENFRLAYEDDDGLYAAVIAQIDKGARDKRTGAATTFGGMQTLRTVFDIYINFQKQTFGDYLKAPGLENDMVLTAKEREALSAIPEDKPMTELSTADFMLIYNTLLPRHIENAKADIIEALEREDSRKGPKRAAHVVLGSDLFPKYKGAVNKINIILTRNMGLDPLTLPNEHNGLEFLRVDPPAQDQTTKETAAKEAQTPIKPQNEQSR